MCAVNASREEATSGHCANPATNRRTGVRVHRVVTRSTYLVSPRLRLPEGGSAADSGSRPEQGVLPQMRLRLPSRRLVRRLLVVGTVATLAVTTFLLSGLMADAAS
jgi:hypothetical protein